MNNRIYKFRAWDKIEGKWVYFHIPNGYSNDDNFIDIRIGGNFDKFCQFTGLKDSKGVEIYEGDIIDGKIVYFDEKIAMFELENSNIRLWAKATYNEVIGNVMENPELIKKYVWIFPKKNRL